MYMNEIIECLVVSALSTLLLCLRLFNKKWANILVYIVFNTVFIALIAIVFNRFLSVPYSFYVLIPYFLFLTISFFVYGKSGQVKAAPQKGEDTFNIETENTTLEFYYPKDNFLVYGGAGSGKTASIGKPLLEQFIKYSWAGFIYDYKDFDYTKTAFNLIKKYNYPYKFFYISFTDMSRTYRMNVLDKRVIQNETILFQAMDDFFNAMKPEKGKVDEWFQAALGLLRGVALRFYGFKGEYEKYCTLPHILNFILLSTPEQLTSFLGGDIMAKMVAGAFLGSSKSERTQSSVIFSINNYISNLATNKNVCYVLSGNDFVFDLVDPEDPKLFTVSNNFALESMISPIVAMLVPLAARRIDFGNKIKFAFVLDEMTTFKVNNFQNMPSVLREYGAAFLIMTQSGSKLENLYGKLDRDSIESNCANLFLGRTKNVESLKYYPLFFGKEEKEKKSYSSGSTKGGGYNSSVTRSEQKEEVFESHVFSSLRQGEFILAGGQANMKRYKGMFKRFQLEEEPLPIVKLTTANEVAQSYNQILIDVDKLLTDFCGI